MDNIKKILFLHGATNVPSVVLDEMSGRAPLGFHLDALTEDAPANRRRELVADADYLVLYGVSFDDLDIANNVRLAQLLSAGFDRLDVNAFKAKGIAVADNGGANAPTVAEHAVLLMLSVYKKLPMHQNALHGGEWLGLTEATRMRELRGKQVGLVGFGRIGQEVARIANGFLAKVAYADPQPVEPRVERELAATRMPLDELLRTSDVVSVHTPLSDATRGFMNAEAFAGMKQSAIFINTSRGPVVDEAALIAAIDSGQIAGAGLDVFEHEPIAADHPLLGRDNVVVTPHTAGTTIDTWTRRLDFAFENIARVARGEPPLSVVNP